MQPADVPHLVSTSSPLSRAWCRAGGDRGRTKLAPGRERWAASGVMVGSWYLVLWEAFPRQQNMQGWEYGAGR